MLRNKIMLAVIASIFFSGCTKQNSHKDSLLSEPVISFNGENLKDFDGLNCGSMNNNSGNSSDLSNLQSINLAEVEAKYSDIPVPLRVQAIPALMQLSPDNGRLCLVYLTALAMQEIKDFYEREMEREGWNYLGNLTVRETMLVFEKPQKLCIISVRIVSEKINKLVINYGRKNLMVI